MFGGKKIMQSSLKKSLYLGLAALSFGAVATVSTTASAKSYATAGAYTALKTDATTRNVEATGTNALYTKPGTVKGAKVVASKATMAELATSKKSANYFRAYGVKTTNRGSVYYRVVTMDGKYRGYVYGGNSDTAFAGGIKLANTLTDATMPVNKTVYLTNTNKNTLWTSPKYTQYKASKVNLQNTTSTDAWTVLAAKTKTREGSLYYYVQNATTPTIKGWIYAGGTSTNSTAATAYNSVTIKYQAADGSTVSTASWVNPKATTANAGQAVADTDVNSSNAKLADFVKSAAPTGYVASSINNDLTGVKYGTTVVINVNKQATSTLSFFDTTNSNGITGGTAMTAANFVGGVYPAVTASAQQAALQGDSTVAFNTDNLATMFKGVAFNSADKTSTTDVKASDGTTIKAGTVYHEVYELDTTSTKAANTNAKYGDNIKVGLKVTSIVAGSATNTSVSDPTNSNYAK
ncbi:surface layer protein a [Levilactobacillus acidifarinae DSM 19394]|uniref:Surface layer protein a n=2 Tax=Levilactobacillus acidifarinae TaxID=267364 RepID=A0A0R1LQD3_9LACO|nr:surface layer protein a [Levilactobacillus acidifarinae DSM 19394]